MFYYNSHNLRNKSFIFLKGFIFEFLIILILCSVLLGFLNYFGIISFSQFTFFLTQKSQIDGKQNVSQTFVSPSISSSNQTEQKSIATGEYKVKIIDINSKGGVMKTGSKSIPYVFKLTVRSDIGQKAFYFEAKDVPNISVYQLTAGKEQLISFSELNIGDNISMLISYNPVNKDLVSLRITKD